MSIIAAERRTRAPSDRRERTRGGLLWAAFELIGDERGLRVRIEEVCAVARVSRGTFYNYFPSLEALFAELWLQLVDEQSALVSAATGGLVGATERTGAAIRCFLGRARLEPRWGWAMVNLATTGMIFGVDAFAHTLEGVDQGIASGEFDIPDARAGRDIIAGAVLVAMVTQLREATPETYPATIADLALRSLGAASKQPRA